MHSPIKSHIGRTSLYESLFEGLRSGIDAYRNMRVSFDRKMAFDFNSLDFFWPGENKVSELLSFFLNPNESHGQGDTFLKAFLECGDLGLEKANAKYKTTGEISVEVEHRTNQGRRIDITLIIGRDKESYWIGIENKVGTAQDQENQITHYSEYLKSKSNNNYVLFYLTPDGEDPSEYSIRNELKGELQANGKLRNLSYTNEIIQIFKQFEQACEADSVRSFIRELIKHLLKRFTGTQTMSESNFIADFISKSNERKLTALEILESKPAVLQPLLNAFTKEIEVFCETSDMELDHIITDANQVICSGSEADFLRIRKANWQHTAIAFSFEKRGGRDFCHGVIKEDAQDEFNDIKERLGYTNGNKYWPIWRYFENDLSNWGDNMEAWKQMISTDDKIESPLMKEFRIVIQKLSEEIEQLDPHSV